MNSSEKVDPLCSNNKYKKGKSYPFERMGTKREKIKSLSSHVTNRLMMRGDMCPIQVEDNYLLSPYKSI